MRPAKERCTDIIGPIDHLALTIVLGNQRAPGCIHQVSSRSRTAAAEPKCSSSYHARHEHGTTANGAAVLVVVCIPFAWHLLPIAA